MTITSVWVRRILMVFLLTPLVLGMGFDEQTFACENAVAHLEACCSGFSAPSALCPQAFGCFGNPSLELSSAESECIKGLDCSAVVSRGLCAKAADLAAQAAVTVPPSSSSGMLRGAVCP